MWKDPGLTALQDVVSVTLALEQSEG